LGEWLGIAIPSGISAVAAYFAWKSYRRRPKLKFYLQNEEFPSVIYDTGRGTAEVHCWLANEGNVAAHNVYGWLQYGSDPEGVWPEESEQAGVKWAGDQYATVYIERLMPAPSWERDPAFLDSPKFFVFPVKVLKAGAIDLRYRFVCDKGAATEGSVRLDFPDVTAG
jgi:hypothetical protein